MALTTLFDLQTSGKRADQETWDMLIEICAVVGKWDAALEIIRDIFAEEVGAEVLATGARCVPSYWAPRDRMIGGVVASVFCSLATPCRGHHCCVESAVIICTSLIKCVLPCAE